MNPLIRAPLAHIEQKRDDFLPGIDFEIEKDKQQFVFDRQEPGFASVTDMPLPYVLGVLRHRDMHVPSLDTGHEQLFEFGLVEPRKRTQRTRTASEAIMGEHRATL